MKTETELKETWCPFARYDDDACNRWHVAAHRNPDTGEQFPNNINTNPEACRCIGIACSQCVDCGPVTEWGPDIPTSIANQEDDPNKPEGDGWYGKNPGLGFRDLRWFRETGERKVYCGRNVGEALRNELSATIYDMAVRATY